MFRVQHPRALARADRARRGRPGRGEPAQRIGCVGVVIQFDVPELGIGAVVVGESLNFEQKENTIMQEVKPFVEKLKTSLGLPVHMHPEFMTSQEAEQIQGKNEMHDASAAALILKSYLDLHSDDNETE